MMTSAREIYVQTARKHGADYTLTTTPDCQQVRDMLAKHDPMLKAFLEAAIKCGGSEKWAEQMLTSVESGKSPHDIAFDMTCTDPAQVKYGLGDLYQIHVQKAKNIYDMLEVAN